MRHEARIAACAHCGTVTRMEGRGLCRPDYRDPTIRELYPSRYRSAQDFAEDYQVLRTRGMTQPQIADAMGYRSWRTVNRLVSRARRRGLLVTS